MGYDHAMEKKVVEWIEIVTGEKKGDQDFGDWLKDGQVLCHLVNGIQPGAVKKVNTSALPFKQMENITYYTDWARTLGVPESAMFATPDLYEAKNLGSVVNCIYTLGGAIQVSCPDFKGPTLGVAINTESKDKKRSSGICTDQSAGYSATLELAGHTQTYNNKSECGQSFARKK